MFFDASMRCHSENDMLKEAKAAARKAKKLLGKVP
jgi:hypothetical protein